MTLGASRSMTTPTTESGVTRPFLEYLRTQRRVSPHTVAAYRSDLALLEDQAAGRELARLSSHDLRTAIARLHAGGRSAASLARTLSAWRAYYRWLTEHGSL